MNNIGDLDKSILLLKQCAEELKGAHRSTDIEFRLVDGELKPFVKTRYKVPLLGRFFSWLNERVCDFEKIKGEWKPFLSKPFTTYQSLLEQAILVSTPEAFNDFHKYHEAYTALDQLFDKGCRIAGVKRPTSLADRVKSAMFLLAPVVEELNKSDEQLVNNNAKDIFDKLKKLKKLIEAIEKSPFKQNLNEAIREYQTRFKPLIEKKEVWDEAEAKLHAIPAWSSHEHPLIQLKKELANPQKSAEDIRDAIGALFPLKGFKEAFPKLHEACHQFSVSKAFPLSKLPYETLKLIFDHLSLKDRVNIARVVKRFPGIAHKTHQEDFSEYQKRLEKLTYGQLFALAFKAADPKFSTTYDARLVKIIILYFMKKSCELGKYHLLDQFLDNVKIPIKYAYIEFNKEALKDDVQRAYLFSVMQKLNNLESFVFKISDYLLEALVDDAELIQLLNDLISILVSHSPLLKELEFIECPIWMRVVKRLQNLKKISLDFKSVLIGPFISTYTPADLEKASIKGKLNNDLDLKMSAEEVILDINPNGKNVSLSPRMKRLEWRWQASYALPNSVQIPRTSNPIELTDVVLKDFSEEMWNNVIAALPADIKSLNISFTTANTWFNDLHYAQIISKFTCLEILHIVGECKEFKREYFTHLPKSVKMR